MEEDSPLNITKIFPHPYTEHSFMFGKTEDNTQTQSETENKDDTVKTTQEEPMTAENEPVADKTTGTDDNQDKKEDNESLNDEQWNIIVRRSTPDDECAAEVTFGQNKYVPVSSSDEDVIPITDLREFIKSLKKPYPSFETSAHECFFDDSKNDFTCVRKLDMERNVMDVLKYDWKSYKPIDIEYELSKISKTQNKDETTSTINDNNDKTDNDIETPIRPYAYNQDSDISFDYYVIRTYNYDRIYDLLSVIYYFYLKLIKFMLMVLTS